MDRMQIDMKTIDATDSEYVCDIQAPCFQALTTEEVDLIQASKTQVLFRKGDNLTKQGAFSSYCLFFVDGLAKQYLEGGSSKSFNLRIVLPGEFVGLSSVFLRSPFQYSCTALTDCKAILIEREAISNLLLSNGSFCFNLTRRYCEQNANLLNSLNTVVYKQMNGRLAETLLYLNNLKTTAPDIFQLLSRKDLADFSGNSTESTVKLLKSFEKDGLIELRDKDILLLQLQSLQEISRVG
jgi:CRP-like cAMP-binding protein